MFGAGFDSAVLRMGKVLKNKRRRSARSFVGQKYLAEVAIKLICNCDCGSRQPQFALILVSTFVSRSKNQSVDTHVGVAWDP